MPSKYNVKEIIRLYVDEGMSSTQLASMFDTYDTTILDILKRNGYSPRTSSESRAINTLKKKDKYNLKIPYDEFLKMVSEYESGDTIANVSDKRNLRHSTVAREFKKYGVHIRTNRESHIKYNLDKEKICQDYIDGKNAYIIAHEQNVSKETIYRILVEFDIKRRSKKRSI